MHARTSSSSLGVESALGEFCSACAMALGGSVEGCRFVRAVVCAYSAAVRPAAAACRRDSRSSMWRSACSPRSLGLISVTEVRAGERGRIEVPAERGCELGSSPSPPPVDSAAAIDAADDVMALGSTCGRSVQARDVRSSSGGPMAMSESLRQTCCPGSSVPCDG